MPRPEFCDNRGREPHMDGQSNRCTISGRRRLSITQRRGLRQLKLPLNRMHRVLSTPQPARNNAERHLLTRRRMEPRGHYLLDRFDRFRCGVPSGALYITSRQPKLLSGLHDPLHTEIRERWEEYLASFSFRASGLTDGCDVNWATIEEHVAGKLERLMNVLEIAAAVEVEGTLSGVSGIRMRDYLR